MILISTNWINPPFKAILFCILNKSYNKFYVFEGVGDALEVMLNYIFSDYLAHSFFIIVIRY